MFNRLVKNSESQNDNQPVSDRQLVIKALKNDQTALAELVKRHLGLVYNVARHYANDADDARDLTQEAFIKIWKNLKKFQPEKSFTAWAYEIAKNTALDWLKKKKAVPFSHFETENDKNYLDKIITDFSPSPDEFIDQSSLALILRGAISRLSPNYQEVVIMHSQDEMTFQEIAESTQQPINTVKSRYRRALNLLKKSLSR
ncbi:MAG: RNA polymerase sigma factor [Patescibacteria group bacterium]|jgi:RNA polymerase sigma-70 factor (ECF subfamily)